MLLIYTNCGERLLSHKAARGCLKLVTSHLFSVQFRLKAEFEVCSALSPAMLLYFKGSIGRGSELMAYEERGFKKSLRGQGGHDPREGTAGHRAM